MSSSGTVTIFLDMAKSDPMYLRRVNYGGIQAGALLGLNILLFANGISVQNTLYKATTEAYDNRLINSRQRGSLRGFNKRANKCKHEF